MTKRAWGLGAMAALAWGCEGPVHVGDLALSPEAGTGHRVDASQPVGTESGASTGSCPVDASGGGSSPRATTYFLLSVNLQSPCTGNTCPCLPRVLPTDATGQATCDLLFELAPTDACAAHGWSEAAPDVVASVVGSQAGQQSGPICAIPQLPSADWVSGSCAGSSQTGWCYVTGAAAGNCAERVTVSASALLPVGAVALVGCGQTLTTCASGATPAPSIGVACTPSPEFSSTFGGFNYREVTLDENNAACNDGVCLVNHFQGLTSCPYGQDQNGLPVSVQTTACTVPGSSTPVRPNVVVGTNLVQSVSPWCTDRTSSDAVYCSCRCANPEGKTDDGASYCACPAGYTCSQVVPTTRSGDPRAGGYCIKTGTALDPNSVCSSQCDPTNHPCP